MAHCERILSRRSYRRRRATKRRRQGIETLLRGASAGLRRLLRLVCRAHRAHHGPDPAHFLFPRAELVVGFRRLLHRLRLPTSPICAGATPNGIGSAFPPRRSASPSSRVGLVTGPIWAHPVWGIWWTWDARLTSAFVLWVLYVCYLLLRTLIDEPERRAVVSAVFGIFAAFDVPLVYFSIWFFRTQHPQPVIGDGGSLDPRMVRRAVALLGGDAGNVGAAAAAALSRGSAALGSRRAAPRSRHERGLTRREALSGIAEEEANEKSGQRDGRVSGRLGHFLRLPIHGVAAAGAPAG